MMNASPQKTYRNLLRPLIFILLIAATFSVRLNGLQKVLAEVEENAPEGAKIMVAIQAAKVVINGLLAGAGMDSLTKNEEQQLINEALTQQGDISDFDKWAFEAIGKMRTEQLRLNRIKEESLNTNAGERDLERLKTQKIVKAIKEILSPQTFGLATGAIVIGTGGYFGFKLLQELAKKFFMKPVLIRSTSIQTVPEKLGFVRQKSGSDVLKLDELKYSPEITTRLNEWINATISARSLGLPYANLMLYGPPGTGKTSMGLAFAQSLKSSLAKKGIKIDYALISGASIAQFKAGEDVQAIYELFDSLQRSKNDTIVIVEEADAALRSRLDPSCTEKMRTALNAWLEMTGTENKKVGFIYLTNLPQTMDPAIRNRIDVQIEIGLPGAAERKDIILMFIKKYITQVMGNVGISAAHITQLVDGTEGFSGRSLSQLVRSLQAAIALTPQKKASQQLVDRVIQTKKLSESAATSYGQPALALTPQEGN